MTTEPISVSLFDIRVGVELPPTPLNISLFSVRVGVYLGVEPSSQQQSQSQGASPPIVNIALIG